jgi:hypothetical protein
LEAIFLGSRVLAVFAVLLFVCAGVFAAPWDVFRGPMQDIDFVAPLVSWLVLAVSAVIFSISFVALRKKYSEKLLWVAFAFGLFFLKGLLIVLDIYLSPGQFMNTSILGFFDLIIMGSFFVALFRK